MSLHFRRILTFLLIVFGLTLVPSTVAAATTQAPTETEQPVKLSLRPADPAEPYFKLTMKPGQTQQLTVVLSNNGSSAMEVKTYPADAYTVINGGFGAKERESQPTGTTTWMDYPAGKMALPAGRSEQRTVSVTVPGDTAPGQYVTSLVLENAEPVKGSGEVALNQVVRQALPITIRVPGPLKPGFEVKDAAHTETAGHSVVDVGIDNTGNAHLEPAGTLIIHDSDGKTVSESKIDMETFIAGTQTRVETTLDGILDPGDYTVDISLKDPDSGASTSTAQLPFTVAKPDRETSDGGSGAGLPGIDQGAGSSVLVYGLAAAVLVLLGAVIFLLLRHRREHHDSG